MRKIVYLVAVIATMFSCTKVEPVINDELPDADIPSVVPGETPRTIRMSASSQSPDTKTTLSGYDVLWDEGDKFAVVSDNVPTLKVVLNGNGQGFGVSVPNVKTAKIKYSYINVNIGGVDVTDDIICKDESKIEDATANSYSIGIPNSQDKYKFPAPGLAVTNNVKSKYHALQVKTYYGATLVRTSSSANFSSSNQAVVKFKGVQYSTDGGNNWNTADENTTFYNGSEYSSLSDVASYGWMPYDAVEMSLASEAGKSYGDFVGVTASDIDETSMAVFPYSAVSSYKDGNLALSLPATQSYVENSFDHSANIMIGKVIEKGDGQYDAHFSNMMGVLRLTLKGSCDVAQIVVTDRGGRQLWGTASIPAASYEEGISTENITSGGPSITLDCGAGVTLSEEGRQFNIVVPAGAFADGFDVTVKTSDGLNASFGTSSSKNKIVCSGIKSMPAKTINPIPEFNIHNIAVAKYLSYPDKPSFDSGRSHFNTHSDLNSTSFYDKDRPEYFHITWTRTSSEDYRVTLTDKTKGTDVYTERSAGNVAEYDLMNMIPGHVYSYTVTDGTSTVRAGEFIATGSVREVTIDDSWNYRDLGGWHSTLGGWVQYEWLFRGGSLNGQWLKNKQKYSKAEVGNIANYNELTPQSRQHITDLGIKAELDLRSSVSEHSNSTDYSHSVALRNSDGSNENEGLPHTGIDGWIYKRIKTADALANPLTNDAIVKDVEWIIGQVMSGNPVAFHCKSGADRTGAVALTILALLGVEDGDIASEYELTKYSSELGRVQQSSSAFRDRKASEGEVYNFYTNGIKKLSGNNLQEKAYFYLNQQFSSTRISAEKLDAFIIKMLGINSYNHPAWAE